MAGQTVTVSDGGVKDGETLGLAVMALVAERRPCRLRQLLEFAGVRVMTAQTVAFSHRRMLDRVIFSEDIVALAAEGRARGDEQLRIIAGMRVMAGNTPGVRDNRMDRAHSFGRVIMTTGTEIRAAGDEELRIFTKVRVMTGNTAVCQGRMHKFLPLALAVMALVAEGSALGNEFESLLAAGMGKTAGFVAGGTIAASQRVMQRHPFSSLQLRVTLSGHAPFGSKQGRNGNEQKSNPEQNRSLHLQHGAVSRKPFTS
jgi:hypothetical protein